MDEAVKNDLPETQISDTSLVAFLALKGHQVKPWVNRESGQVEFTVRGNLQTDEEAFYNNESVGIQDFCRKLKEIKSAMYNLKKTIKERYE